MLEDRDNALKACLESRDKYWLNNLAHCNESFRLMTYEKVNNMTLLESLAKRQRELTESNAKILDWAMKKVSSKKKVPLPHIRILECVPYTIVPRDVTKSPIPFSNPNPEEEISSEPCKAPVQNKTPSATGKKEKGLKKKKKMNIFSFFPFVTISLIPEKLNKKFSLQKLVFTLILNFLCVSYLCFSFFYLK